MATSFSGSLFSTSLGRKAENRDLGQVATVVPAALTSLKNVHSKSFCDAFRTLNQK